jgi:hypothetical protein
MSKQFSKAWRNIGWLVSAAVICALVIFNAATIFQASRWRAEIRDLTARSSEMKYQAEMHDWLNRRAEQAYKQLKHDDRQLMKTLSTCTSREDFAVKSGQRIVWSKLPSEDKHVARIGLYLPAGTHQLRYATFDLNKIQAHHDSVRHRLRWGPVDQIPVPIAGCELEGAPQVYEIHLKSASGEPPRLAVLGPNDVREFTLPLKLAVAQLQTTMARRTSAYPSEGELHNESMLVNDRRILLQPMVDLAVISIQGQAEIRLWIESDAPACLSALEVAANYRLLDRDLVTLFSPYDGSNRLFFRPTLVSGNLTDKKRPESNRSPAR